jgi:alpha-beta hydrolase superfamily lysophospholipase
MKSYEGKLVEFKTKDNIVLHGFLQERKKNNKKIVIHVHGMTGYFYRSNFLEEMSKQLSKEYDLLTINTRGAGVITKFYYKNTKRTYGTAYEKVEDCLLDIDQAIKEMLKQGYKEIVLSGHSTGCQKVTYYQGKIKNKFVKRIILLAPADDYNVDIFDKGKDYSKAVALAKKMVRAKKGNELMPKEYSPYSAQRYLSFADPRNVEAQLFNYSGKLKYFSQIKIPILAVFGEKEEHAAIKPKEMLSILREKTNSEFLETVEIKNANHSFLGKEKKLMKIVSNFLKI